MIKQLTFAEIKVENKRPKVIFTFTEAGMGHITPMAGMAKAFSIKYGDKCDVKESYVFKDSKEKKVRKMGDTQVKFIKLLSKSWLYRKIEGFSYRFSSRFTLKILDVFFRGGRKKFFKEFAEVKPDLLVSSFYQPAHLAREANDRKLTDTLIATYSPDPYIYPAWDRKCDLMLVNNEAAEKCAIKKGFKKEQVKRVPFIFSDKVVANKKTREEARAELGLPEKGVTVLITSGAYGATRNKKLVRRLFSSDLDMNVVFVFGKSEGEIPKFMKLAEKKKDGVKFFPVGFTDKLSDYMIASDIIIGKTGSNTVAEAAHFGRPMILNATAGKLEEITAEYYEKTGVAVRMKSVKKIANVIEMEIRTGNGFMKESEKCAPYKDCTGAEKAADLLFELLKTRYPDL